MASYLVTGGAGFIGSHLCDALVARGDTVRVLDDLSTGHLENLPAGVDFLQGDIADLAMAQAAMDGIDGCFHLAAIASVERGVTDWTGTHRVNLSGTIALFDAIRRSDKKIPMVYASSAAVYGDAQTIPIAEETDRNPLSAYGADKLGCELHAKVASHVHGIPSAGFRFFNVYGPRQDPRSPYTGVISIFCERIGRGAPIAIYGDGGQTRDFVHVSDVVAALLGGMALRPADAPVFNVCTGNATSVLDLAHLIASLVGNRLEYSFQPPRAGEIRHSLGDPARLRAAMHPNDPVKLRDGLREVLAWMASSR
jgi:UDP-glucose 4-epimerase